MASPENIGHNELEGWLYSILQTYVRRRGLGRVTISRVAYRLAPRQGPEPDVAFVAAARANIVRKGYVEGPPDLAIEIVSPDSVDRDYEQKRRQYEQAGVHEYWIIDPDEKRATFLVRGERGFVDAAPADHVFHSQALPGFHLDVRWLWQQPLPDSLEIVQQLLST